MLKLSIVIPIYNERETLETLVAKVSAVDYDKEIVLIDDHSTDNSLKLLQGYKKYIKLILNKKNKGIGYCSNLAVKKAKGKYFLRVDSDDYLNKFTVHIMTQILENNKNISFVYADHYRVDEFGVKQKCHRLT